MYASYERYGRGAGSRLLSGLLLPLVKVVALTLVLYLVLTTLFLSSFRVESTSMLPSLEEGNRVLVSPLIYGPKLLAARLPGLREPQRGDIVVLLSPVYPEISPARTGLEYLLRFFSLQHGVTIRDRTGRPIPRFLVKRIIGVPGDTVRISDNVAYLRPPGAQSFIEERELIGDGYTLVRKPPPDGWQEGFPASGTMEPITLGEDQYFLLGDNRTDSSDSRSWGPVSKRLFLGRAFYRYWPFSQGGGL